MIEDNSLIAGSKREEKSWIGFKATLIKSCENSVSYTYLGKSNEHLFLFICYEL